jgi:hypothetical protein
MPFALSKEVEQKEEEERRCIDGNAQSTFRNSGKAPSKH